MKCFSVLTLVLTTTLILSACGAQATPTPIGNAVDIQGTVAAAAFTMVAETQAALPTATPPPPTATFTDTPVSTNTLPPFPSTEVIVTPVPSENAVGGDPCINQVLPATLPGETVRIRIDNSTEAALSITVYLNQTEPQDECGYRSYTLAPGQFVLINDLVEGCYTLWAWNPDPEAYFIVTNGTSCLDNSKPWEFDISTSSIKLGT